MCARNSFDETYVRIYLRCREFRGAEQRAERATPAHVGPNKLAAVSLAITTKAAPRSQTQE